MKRIYAGESQKKLCKELGISKSTQEERFVEILKSMKETNHKLVFRYETADTEHKGY